MCDSCDNNNDRLSCWKVGPTFESQSRNFDFLKKIAIGFPNFLVYNDLAGDFSAQLCHIIFVDFHQLVAVVSVVAVVAVVSVVAVVAVVAVVFSHAALQSNRPASNFCRLEFLGFCEG